MGATAGGVGRTGRSGWQAAFAALMALTAMTGCVSPCMEIQRTMCLCRGQTQNERGACEDIAAAQERLDPPDEAQLAQCEQLLPACQALVADGRGCAALQTNEGRVICGITPAP